MSLLLKALKQAETDDSAGKGRRAPDDRRDPDLDLEPLAATASAREREWVEPPGLLFGAVDTPAPAPARSAPALRLPRLSLVPLTALIAIAVALGYGVYLYFALQPPAALPAPVTAEAGMAPAAALPPPAEEPAPVTAAPAPERPALPSAAPPPAAQDVRTGAPAAAPTPLPTPERARPASGLPAPAAGAPQFQADPQSTLLTHAWAAYQRGAFDEAGQAYARANRGGKSVDALLGLAAVAGAQNRDAEAQHLYRQVLDLDPRNPVAQAALLDLLGNTDTAATESRLKTLIEREPGPQLYQTLGNLYAGQQRWGEAQAAYYEAVRTAPENADYAFNLAVSLDQLRQYPAALAYYEKALAGGGAHRFDRAQAEMRVQQLRALR